MRRTIIYLVVAIVITATLTTIALRRHYQPEAMRAEAAPREAVGQNDVVAQQKIISAPGLIEPISEEIEIGAEMSGKIKKVLVEEGQRIARDQVLAVLENDDYAAQVASAESNIASSEAQNLAAQARLEQGRAELRRIVNGARIEERRESRASVEQAEAVERNARTELERRRVLFADGYISREEFERAERDARVAEARNRELSERFGFVNATAREEDVERAEATIRLSQAQLKESQARIAEARARRAEANARLDKTFIRSPIAGVVLRKRLKAGESVAPESANNSIFTVADTSALRVRVDVDERDVGGVNTGQQAYVTAEAYGARKFTGRVISVGQILGRKNIRTEEPTERVDKKILETLVELDAGQRLPPGLRVDAYIFVSESRIASVTPPEKTKRP